MVVSKTKHAETKIEARSTPKLEKEAPEVENEAPYNSKTKHLKRTFSFDQRYGNKRWSNLSRSKFSDESSTAMDRVLRENYSTARCWKSISVALTELNFIVAFPVSYANKACQALPFLDIFLL